jgi:hypothetical protein
MLPARDNPFAVHRVLALRYRLGAAEWVEVFDRWEKLGRRGAIVGPHGSGKTTLLEDMARRLEGDGWKVVWVRLDEQCRSLRAAVEQGRAQPFFGAVGNLERREHEFRERRRVVVLDGAEQLSRLDWWRLSRHLRHADGVVITAHRPGLLSTLWQCRTDAGLLRGLCAELGYPLEMGEAEALWTRFDGNVREALRWLYDRAAAGCVATSPAACSASA